MSTECYDDTDAIFYMDKLDKLFDESERRMLAMLSILEELQRQELKIEESIHE